MSHKVSTTWKENMHFESTNPGGTLDIDAGVENGGEGKGYRPKANAVCFGRLLWARRCFFN